MHSFKLSQVGYAFFKLIPTAAALLLMTNNMLKQLKVITVNSNVQKLAQINNVPTGGKVKLINLNRSEEWQPNRFDYRQKGCHKGNLMTETSIGG